MSTLYFWLDLHSDYSLTMALILYFFPEKKSFNPLCFVTRYIIVFKMASLSLNQFSIDEIKKISRISINTCVIIVEVMIAISLWSLNDMQLHIINDLGNSPVFFRPLSLYFMWTACEPKCWFSLCKSYIIQLTSFCSDSIIDSSFEPFVFYL